MDCMEDAMYGFSLDGIVISGTFHPKTNTSTVLPSRLICILNIGLIWMHLDERSGSISFHNRKYDAEPR